MLQHVIEADEPHVHAHARQRLQNAVIRIRLLVRQRVGDRVGHPRTHLAPAVQDRHVEHAAGRLAVGAVVDVAELVGDVGDGIDELRELRGQRQVSAVAHAGDRGTQDGTTGLAPVVPCLDARVVALVERVGEEIRQETTLRVLHARDVRDHAGRGAVTDRTDDSIQAQILETILVRLGTDPLVTQEHHRFLAGGVGHVGELLDIGANETGEEVDPVALGLARHAPRGVIGAAIYEVFGTQAVAVLLLEVVERGRAHGAGASEPVHDLLALLLVEQQRELVEERRETHDIHLRVVLEPLLERVEHELARRRVVDIERNLVLLVAPPVRQVVVHLDRIPDDVREERDRVLVHQFRAGDMHGIGVLIKRPQGGIHDLIGGAVHDFPVLVRVGVTVRLELLLEEAVHQGNIHDVRFRQDAPGEQVHLRGLVHVQRDPLVVCTGREVGAVDLLAEREHGLVKVCAVGITDGISAPQFGKFLGFFSEVLFTGQCEAASAGHGFSFLGTVIGERYMGDEITKADEMAGIIAGPLDPDCANP